MKKNLGVIILFMLFCVCVVPQSAQAVDGEITYVATNTNLIGDDVSAGPFNLGFTFNYYGVNYTQAYVNINGTITFGTGFNAYANGALNTTGADNTIYAFWDDLNTLGARNIYYRTIGTAPNRKFITQWTNIYFHGTTIQMGTFQIILNEGSNDITLQYRDLLGGDRALGNSATIGIKKNSSTYEQYSNGTASLTQGQSILYSQNGSNDYNVNTNAAYDLVYLAPEDAPGSPTLVNPTDGSTGVTLTPTFEWLPVDLATSYTALISTVSNFSSTVVNQSGITGTSYTPGSALNQSTNYYWRVQAVNSNGSSLSPTRSFTTGSANSAPSTPSGISSATFTGSASSSSLAGQTLEATLADPDDNEQVRYRIQMATDVGFSELVLDYRSPFGAEGPITYTYGETGGTYLVGTSTTILPIDSYYLRIRTEDDAAASSAWHTVSGIAFNVIAMQDITPPVISSISVTSIGTTTANIIWTTNESADSQIDYGTTSSYGTASSSSSLSTSHSIFLIGLSPETVYHYRVQSADSESNTATSSDLTFTTESLPDTTAPGISDLSVSPEQDSAIILWTTDEAASSIVEFGPSSMYTASTTEVDISPRVTNHEITIPNLEACVTYHYRVVSRDASSNEVTSSDNRFTTKGCTGSAVVTSQTASSVATSTGGTVDLKTSGLGITLSIPASFSTSSAHFQIKKIDDSAALASTSVPANTVSVGTYTYELHAVTDDFQVIENFDEPITLTLAYGASDVNGIVETSLQIYRWHNSEWQLLPDCVVDTNSKTVTCTTNHFSTFALFGQTQSTEVSVSRKSTSGTTIKGRVLALTRMGKKEEAENLKKEWPQVFATTNPNISDTTTTPEVIKSIEVRDLELGMEGDDIKKLQQLLITVSSGAAAQELSRVGITGYFGSYTKNALGEYQKNNSILPHAGYFGPLTRSYMKEKNPELVWW